MKEFPLHQAIREKNTEAVRTLIAEGVNVNEKEEKTGNTPLHVAVEYETNKILKLLLESGVEASMNTNNHNYQTPLQLAVKSIKKDALKILLEAVGDKELVNVRFSNNATLLHLAAEHGNPDILKILIQYGAKALLSVKTVDGYNNSFNKTPLVILFEQYLKKQSNNKIPVESVKILLDAGASPNDFLPDYSCYNHNMLLAAIGENDEKLVEILINAKVYVNMTQNGHTPLIIAIKQGKKRRIIELLVEAGAGLNLKTTNGISELQLASEKNDVDLIKYLMSHGANFTGLEISSNTVVLQLILDQLTTLNKKFEQEKQVQVERWNDLEKKIEKIEESIGRKISLLGNYYEEEQERIVENSILDELQVKIEKLRPKPKTIINEKNQYRYSSD